MTWVLPKLFSMFWNDTDAISAYPQSLTARLFSISSLHCAGGKPSDHVPLERVIDRRRRHRVNEANGHQELPWRVVSRQKVAERDGQRDLPVMGKQQESVQIFVPRQKQRVGSDGEQRRH